MTIKVYVNNEYEVISENQYKAIINRLAEDELYNFFDQWLNSLPIKEAYRSYDLLLMESYERDNVLTTFREWLKNTITSNIEDEWYEREIDV